MNGNFIVIDGIDGIGKSTLVKNIQEVLSRKTDKVVVFSPSDLCRNGFKETFEHLPEDNMINTITNAIFKVQDALQELKYPLPHYSKETVVAYNAYLYNRIADAYMELGKAMTPYISSLLTSGYTVIADRWMSSTIAYNYGVKKTYISNLIKYKNKSERWSKEVTFINPKRCYKDTLDVEKYINITEHIKKRMDSIIIPDVTIFLFEDNVKSAIDNIKARGTLSDFEKENRLLRTQKLFYKMFIEPYNIENSQNYIYTPGKYKYGINDVLSKGINRTLEIALDILKRRGIGI